MDIHFFPFNFFAFKTILFYDLSGMISPHGDALLSDIDFERLKDDVFSGPPDDSLGVPGSLLGSHDAMNISSSANFGPPPYSLLWQNQDPSRPVAAGFIPHLKKSSVSAVISSLGLQSATSLAQKAQIVSGKRLFFPASEIHKSVFGNLFHY